MTAENGGVEQEGGGPLARLARRLRDDARPLPGARVLRTGLRAAHIMAAAVLYGGHVYGVSAERLLPALAATLATGGALVALEVFRVPVWLVQLRGIATLAKLALVGSVAVLWDLRILLLTLAMVIGVVAAHMPGRFRYHSLLHGRVVGPLEKG